MSRATIRRAGEGDERGIAVVHVASWQAAYRGLVPDHVLEGLSVDEGERVWRAVLSEPAGRYPTLVFELEGEIAGFCSLATPSQEADAHDGIAEVTALYVAPGRWGGGIGDAVLRAAMDELRCAGYREATLWVLAANNRARKLYARRGFEPDGDEKVHASSGEQEVRLRARLTS